MYRKEKGERPAVVIVTSSGETKIRGMQGDDDEGMEDEE
jgi:hypothetical protein